MALQQAAPELAADTGRPAAPSRWRSATLPRVLSVVIFLVGWQLIVPILPTELLPMPAEVGEFIWNEVRGETIAPYTVYQAFGETLSRLAVGLLIAFVAGTAIGVAMGISRRAEAAIHDFVIGGLTMPYLVWALVPALWFGFTFLTPVVAVMLAAIPFVVSNVAEGVRGIPKDLVDMSRAYGVPRWRMFLRLVLPSLAPFLFASFRYGVSLGWKALALAEVFGADSGAGWMLRYWYDAHRVTGLVGYAFFFILFSALVDQIMFNWLHKRVFRWRPEIAGRPAA